MLDVKLKLQSYLSEGRSLIKRVTGDSQEHIKQRVVSAECEHHKIQTVHHATIMATSFGIDGIVHNLVPVFTSKNLKVS